MSAAAFVTLGAWLTEHPQQPYWLIDPVLDDPAAYMPELANCIKHPLLIVHPDAGSFRLPYVLRCPEGHAGDKIHDALLAHALNEAAYSGEGQQRRSVAALFFTSLPLPELVFMLQRAAVVRDRSRRARVLRYWDPRVFPALANSDSLRSFLPSGCEPVHWACLDAAGTWKMFELPTRWPLPDDSPVSNHLSQAQEAELRRLSLGNRVIERMQRENQPVDLASAHQAVGRAAATELTSDDDIVVLACARLRNACPIELAPPMRELIELCITQDITLAALVGELSDTDWARIREESNRKPATA
jgi:hypothetical protein